MIVDYIYKYKRIHLPYVANKFGITLNELKQCVIENEIYGEYYEGLYCIEPDERTWFYEICDTKYNRGTFVEEKSVPYNDKPDQHMSVLLHDQVWADHATKTKKVNARNTYVKPKYIYLELDRDNIDDAITDALSIYYNFEYPEYMTLWYSGNRSIHIGVDAGLFGSPIDRSDRVCGLGHLYYNLAHKIAGDVRYRNGLVDSWTITKEEAYEQYNKLFDDDEKDLQKVRQRLENIDPNLFRLNSLIRMPGSVHEKTGNKKIQLCPNALLAGEMKETHGKRHCEFPYLLHWTMECYEPVIQKPKIKAITNKSLVINTFSENIEGFDPADADESGWCGDYYSPFYADTNPSVRVNIKTGAYCDFGNPMDWFGFVDFLRKIHEKSA